MKNFHLLGMFILIIVWTGAVNAYTVPQEDSNVQYFYVTGPEGSPLRGAEDHVQVLNIDVPENTSGDVRIAVFDPGTGGAIDARPSKRNKWDTITEISVYGNDLLAKELFGSEGYDQENYVFGPYDKTAGKHIAGFYRFTLVVKAIEGDDSNLFNVNVKPDSAEISSTNITFRLLSGKGKKMYFYPRVPEGTEKIIVENYDLDREGGSSKLFDEASSKYYVINDSTSGKWSQTTLKLSSTQSRTLKYIITKGTQNKAHAAIRIKDENGNLLPIYFKPSKVSKPGIRPCNEFTFDATRSYDPDKQAITFLWNFGDGATSTEPVVTHLFEQGGAYNVTLTVSDNSGLECESAVTSQVVDVNSAPDANFVGQDIACTDQPVAFDASSTTDNTPDQVTYNWNFGDGTTGEGQQVTKVYTTGGTYRVNLMVNDNANTTCSTDSTEKTIVINTPPVADAGKDIDLCLPAAAEYNVTFDGSGSTDADGDVLTYSWDFGDGNTGSGAKTSHTYSQSGKYTTRLIINDGSGAPCNTSVDTIDVNLNKSPVANAGEDKITCVGNEVVFDGSSSHGEPGENITYSWDFGDGSTAQGVSVSHSYSVGGNYKVVLTVDDGLGTRCSVAADSTLVSVNTAPTAVLVAVDTVCTGDEVAFDASGTNDADGDSLTYSWDFGDGTVVQGGSGESHSYDKGGDYLVRVEVNDNKNTNCSIDVVTINVKVNAPPIADAGPNLVCCLEDESVFDGSNSNDPDGDALTYMWNFGDGSTGEGARVTHVYTKSGKFIVTLTVNDNTGTKCSSASDSFTANVNARPTPIIEIR
ncbi:MAG: PKD domain-containing protein [Candidatus Anammoxibacter sp.]